MSYGTIYTIPFATLNNEACVIEIEKENYTGESTELQPADKPFTVDIDDEDFIYTPTRFSTAKISIAGSDYLQELFSTSYRQFRVTFKKNGVITWCGYIKPELYTQDYVGETFVLEIECMSAMSVLEYIDYKASGSEKGFVSLWSLLQKCIDESRGRYNGVYIPHVYAKNEADYNAGLNPITDMIISEQNFFDEDNKAMTLKDVLEAICNFFNWMCVDWKGDLYFSDVDHKGKYFYYNPTLESKTDAAINSLIVQNIGFAGSNNTYDRLPGYNKVTVKDSNYPVGQVFPEESENLRRLGTKWDYARDYTVKNKVSRKMYYLPDVYKMYHYQAGTVQNEVPESSLKNMALNDIELLLGAIPIKRCNYEMVKINGGWQPNITSYNYEDLIQIRTVLYPEKQPEKERDYVLKDGKPLLTFAHNLPSAVYADGAFSIQGSIQLVRTTSFNVSEYDPISEMYSFGDPLPNSSIPYFVCELSVGDKYWDGSQFTSTKSDFKVYISDGDKEEFAEPVPGGFLSIKSTKTLNMPYDGLSGYIIPIADTLTGKLNFTIKKFNAAYLLGNYNCFLKGLKCVFQPIDGDTTQKNTDRTYENVINSEYINKLDEIEFKITSYNNDGACYSKVLCGGSYLTDNLWNVLLKSTKRPEEMLITRIINHYSATRVKLTQVIKERSDLSPFTRLSDETQPNKEFIITGGTINYKMGSFSCIMIEKE